MRIFVLITWFSALWLCDGYQARNRVFCDVINKFKKLNSKVNSLSGFCRRVAPIPTTKDCSNILSQTTHPLQDGVFKINPSGGKGEFDVYCEMTKGEGWLVIQRRIDGSKDFYRGWADYERGFGDLSGEFWLGNDKISQITSQGNYELRIDMEDFHGSSIFADYESFLLGDASTSFQLQVSGFSGNKAKSVLKFSQCMEQNRICHTQEKHTTFPALERMIASDLLDQVLESRFLSLAYEGCSPKIRLEIPKQHDSYAEDGNSLKIHNHMPFSTYDFDNDNSTVNCAQQFLGAWWYNNCMSSNLNGHYTENVPSHGIVWETWKNDRLKHVVMKIRPKQIV